MKKLIFSSSATVYTADNEMPLRETSRTGGCTNPYGWTKYMTEQILSGIAKRYAPEELVGKGVIGLDDTPKLAAPEMQQKFEETARGVIIPKQIDYVFTVSASISVSTSIISSSLCEDSNNRYLPAFPFSYFVLLIGL